MATVERDEQDMLQYGGGRTVLGQNLKVYVMFPNAAVTTVQNGGLDDTLVSANVVNNGGEDDELLAADGIDNGGEDIV